MIFAFMSRRLRQWLLLTVALPVTGRLLQRLGVSLGRRNARAGDLLQQAGGLAAAPRSRAARRRARRRAG